MSNARKRVEPEKSVEVPNESAAKVFEAPAAARYLGLAPATLAKLRCCGGSPEFLKLGRKVVYERRALDIWLDRRRAVSTSDADLRLPRRLTDSVNPVA